MVAIVAIGGVDDNHYNFHCQWRVKSWISRSHTVLPCSYPTIKNAFGMRRHYSKAIDSLQAKCFKTFLLCFPFGWIRALHFIYVYNMNRQTFVQPWREHTHRTRSLLCNGKINNFPIKMVKIAGSFFKKNIAKTFFMVCISLSDWNLAFPGSYKMNTKQRKYESQSTFPTPLGRIAKVQWAEILYMVQAQASRLLDFSDEAWWKLYHKVIWSHVLHHRPMLHCKY